MAQLGTVQWQQAMNRNHFNHAAQGLNAAYQGGAIGANANAKKRKMADLGAGFNNAEENEGFWGLELSKRSRSLPGGQGSAASDAMLLPQRSNIIENDDDPKSGTWQCTIPDIPSQLNDGDQKVPAKSAHLAHPSASPKVAPRVNLIDKEASDMMRAFSAPPDLQEEADDALPAAHQAAAHQAAAHRAAETPLHAPEPEEVDDTVVEDDFPVNMAPPDLQEEANDALPAAHQPAEFSLHAPDPEEVDNTAVEDDFPVNIAPPDHEGFFNDEDDGEFSAMMRDILASKDHDPEDWEQF